MAEITVATITGWVIVGLIAYILGEYTSVFARVASRFRLAGGGVKKVKGRRARQGAAGLGGLFAGMYAGGFIWAFIGSLIAGGGAAGGAVALGLTVRQTLVVFLAAMFVGLSLYTGAAADEAMEDDGAD